MGTSLEIFSLAAAFSLSLNSAAAYTVFCPTLNPNDPLSETFRVSGGAYDGQCADTSSHRTVRVLTPSDLTTLGIDVPAPPAGSPKLIIGNIVDNIADKTHDVGVLDLSHMEMSFVQELKPFNFQGHHVAIQVTFPDGAEQLYPQEKNRKAKIPADDLFLSVSPLDFPKGTKATGTRKRLDESDNSPLSYNVLRADAEKQYELVNHGEKFVSYKLDLSPDEKTCVFKRFTELAASLRGHPVLYHLTKRSCSNSAMSILLACTKPEITRGVDDKASAWDCTLPARAPRALLHYKLISKQTFDSPVVYGQIKPETTADPRSH